MVQSITTIAKVSHILFIDNNPFDINLEITHRVEGKNKSTNTKVTYFSGNDNQDTYNWFSHLNTYFKHINRTKQYDMYALEITYDNAIGKQIKEK